LRSALSQHASLGSLAVFDASVFEAPSTAQAFDLLEEWGAATPTLVVLSDEEADAGKSFRNLARVSVMPVEDAGVADVIGAASLLISQAALPSLVARALDRDSAALAGEEAPAPAPRRRATKRAAEPAPEEETSTPPHGDELGGPAPDEAPEEAEDSSEEDA
jgi:ADP-heptose:LPS heptosyltransferase